MFQRLHSRMRAILAMFCMALVTVLAAQGAVTSVDRTQHALGLDHVPNAMAGVVHYDHDDHDDHTGLEAATDVPDPASNDDDARGTPHHHFAEGSQLATPVSERLAETPFSRAISQVAPPLDASALLVTGRLERPPKPVSKLDA